MSTNVPLDLLTHDNRGIGYLLVSAPTLCVAGWYWWSALPTPKLVVVLAVFVVQVLIIHLLNQGGRFPKQHVPNLRGKVAIVTGGNNGMGFRVSATLAKWGAQVIIGCRNVAGGEAAARSILREIGGTDPNQIKVIPLDLGSLASVRVFVAAWRAQSTNGRLDLLINNAGIMSQHMGVTKEGFEHHFGTNHLGHFLLTNLLTDAIKASKGRVVNVASMQHVLAGENPLPLDAFEHPPTTGNYEAMTAYGFSKACNVLHARELNRRLEGSGATAYSVNPGGVNTEVVTADMGKILGPLLRHTVGWTLLKSPQVAAETILHCAVHPDAVPGGYHKDGYHTQPYTRLMSDDAEARRLWEASERWCAAAR